MAGSKITFLRARPKKPEKKTSTEAKAKLELLTEVRLNSKTEIEDIMGVKTGSEIEEMEAMDSLHEKDLFRRGLGFEQIAERGYAITAENVKHYYRLKILYHRLLERDPNHEKALTRKAYSRFLNAKNNLLQRTMTKKQTNVEVVDQEPIVKYIPVPQYGVAPTTDMEKKDED